MRIRFRFAKLGRIRFTSQRDVARMWERALRRAELPVSYTGGFSPRPQLSFGLALPTGCESLAEYVDVAFDEVRAGDGDLDVEVLVERISDLFPRGIEVTAAAVVGREESSLQQVVTACSWVLDLRGVTAPALGGAAEVLLASGHVPVVRERKGRIEEDDLRPSVLALGLDPGAPIGDGQVRLVADLATRPRGVRPKELLGALDAIGASGSAAGTWKWGSPVLDRACRTQQWIERDGLREEPLRPRGVPTDDHRAAHVLERAS